MAHQRAAAAIAVALLVWAVPASAQRLTLPSVEAVERWAEAVNVHVPGAPDAAVAAMAAVTYGARVQLDTSFPLFIRALRNPDGIDQRSELSRRVVALAVSLRRTPGAAAFLRRAATLHFDAVVFARRFPAPPDDAPYSPRTESIAGVRRPIAASSSSPLLTHETVTLTRDGQIIGDTLMVWHLPFARSLLDEMAKLPVTTAGAPDQAFISEWYHAVSAFLFASGMNGDATPHLEHAARVLPEDAHALFDRGIYAETFGLPIYQVVQDEESKDTRVTSKIPAEAKTNAEAERLYRHALDVDPSYVEARVRLARLLTVRGALDEAANVIAKALEAQPSGVVGYYAQIVAGRTAAARGLYDEALRHYDEASRLYPDAQSARLGASHAALMLSDVPRTLARLDGIGRERSAEADPWLDYRLGAGRDPNGLILALWAHAVRP